MFSILVLSLLCIKQFPNYIVVVTMKKTIIMLFFACLSTVAFSQSKEKIYDLVEQRAQYPGGISALSNELQAAFIKPSGSTGGMLVLRLVVEKDGSVQQAEVYRKLAGCESCNRNALATTKRIKNRFSPAKRGGLPVRSYFSIPMVVE